MMSEKKIKAAIFDLDGTILYTLPSIAKAGNRMLADLGFPPRPEEEYRYYCGDGSWNLAKRTLIVSMGESNLSEEQKLSLIDRGDALNRKYLAEDPMYKMKPYEGIPEALAALKRRGLSLAVFSNKPDAQVREIIPRFFGDMFDVIQGQTGSMPIKPDPAGALAITDLLGIHPSEVMYFGDSGTDMRTGKAAGMYTVGCMWGYRTEEELWENGADRVISAPSETLNLTP